MALLAVLLPTACAKGVAEALGGDPDAGTATDAAPPDGALPDVGPTAEAGTDAKPDASSGPCLLISEYAEGTGTSKALEIWNCGVAPLTMDRYGICLQTNSATAGCSMSLMLSGTLPAGSVQVVCEPSFSHASCTVKNGVAAFNGDDRVGILHDDDADGTLDLATDTVVDSFGRLGTVPPGTPWQDVTYRRRQCAPYTGAGAFDVNSLYTSAAADDFSDLGRAPSLTCP